MRPHGSPQELERRRRRAVALLQKNLTVHEVARRVAATPKSVWQWWKQYEQGGDAALAAKPASGRPRKLTERQMRGLRQRLLKGARSQGFETQLWTCRRVQELIHRCYGVHYHVSHVDRLLQQLNFSPSEARTPRDRAG